MRLKKGLLLKPGPGPGPWTRTRTRTLGPGPGPWALDPDPEKPGINIGSKNMPDFRELCFTKTIGNESYCNIEVLKSTFLLIKYSVPTYI